VKEAQKSWTVRVSTRGRATIPIALRRRFGLTGGKRMAFMVTPLGFVMRLEIEK
jgi:bifunctional DNA-binding transcriptional regulator/antitoxin component of YhaV-PrlF toxin-antitoxin module